MFMSILTVSRSQSITFAKSIYDLTKHPSMHSLSEFPAMGEEMRVEAKAREVDNVPLINAVLNSVTLIEPDPS